MEGLWLDFVPDTRNGCRQRPLLCAVRLNEFPLIYGVHVLQNGAAVLREFQRGDPVLVQEHPGPAAVFAEGRLIQQACAVGWRREKHARNRPQPEGDA